MTIVHIEPSRIGAAEGNAPMATSRKVSSFVQYESEVYYSQRKREKKEREKSKYRTTFNTIIAETHTHTIPNRFDSLPYDFGSVAARNFALYSMLLRQLSVRLSYD